MYILCVTLYISHVYYYAVDVHYTYMLHVLRTLYFSNVHIYFIHVHCTFTLVLMDVCHILYVAHVRNENVCRTRTFLRHKQPRISRHTCT